MDTSPGWVDDGGALRTATKKSCPVPDMSRSVRVLCWVLSASALAGWWVVDTFLGPKHAVAFPVGGVAPPSASALPK
jgi:hypothetical protein